MVQKFESIPQYQSETIEGHVITYNASLNIQFRPC